MADIVLPSFEDEHAAFGDASPVVTAERYHRLGATEVVVKNGADEIHWITRAGRGKWKPPPAKKIVDATAAGDSFNAAFLAARLSGADPGAAIVQAARMAAQVIEVHGALVPL